MANEKKSRPTRKITLVYTNADVKSVRPDLTAAQCGKVMDYVYDNFDYIVGASSPVLSLRPMGCSRGSPTPFGQRCDN